MADTFQVRLKDGSVATIAVVGTGLPLILKDASSATLTVGTA